MFNSQIGKNYIQSLMGHINLKGFKATTADLPLAGNVLNDIWIVRADDHWYTWDKDAATGLITDWADMGGAASVDWSVLTNKPSSSVSDIDAAVADRHSQGTDQELDKGGASEVTVAQVKDAVTKVHDANTDTILDSGGANEISASQIPKKATANVIYYIDATNGNDSNPGTDAEPFLTIQQAIDLIPLILVDKTYEIILKPSLAYAGDVNIFGFQGGYIDIHSQNNDNTEVLLTATVDGLFFNDCNSEIYINYISVKANANNAKCFRFAGCGNYAYIYDSRVGDNGNTGTQAIQAYGSIVYLDTITNIDANKCAKGLVSRYSRVSVASTTLSDIGDTASDLDWGSLVHDNIEIKKADYDSAVSLKHAINGDTQLGTMAANINMNSHKLTSLSVPASNGDSIRATTKITEANLESAIDLKHSANGDTDLDATFEATFMKKANNVNELADITSTGANIEDAVTKKHTQNTDTQLDSGVLEVDASDNLVLTQNSVAVMTSLNASAVVNTLYLKEGNVGIGTVPGSVGAGNEDLVVGGLGRLIMASTEPYLIWQDTNVGANNGLWDFAAMGTYLKLRAVADNYGSASEAFSILRNGVNVTQFMIPNAYVGIGTITELGTLLQLAKDGDAYITLQNLTAEHTDGGAETRIIFEDHGNNALAQIQASHDGAADDCKGDLILSTHSGSALTEHLRIDSAGVVSISDGTIPSWGHSPMVGIEGVLEVDGTAYFDTHVVVGGNQTQLRWEESGNPSFMFKPNYSCDQMMMIVDDEIGNQIVLLDYSGRAQDFDHPLQPNPTLFIQSITLPSIRNNEWGSLSHDKQNYVITTGAQIGAGTGVAQACTATNATNLFTDVGHILSDDDRIMIGGDAVPTGIDNTAIYYVISDAADTFQVSLTSGGGAVTFSDDGTNVTWSYASDNAIVFAPRGTEALRVSTSGILLANGTTINEFSIDDTLGGDSDDAVPTEQAVKAYVDGVIHTQGTDTALGAQAENLDMNTHKIVSVTDPTADQDAATKKYVDDNSINNLSEDTTPEFGGEVDAGEHSIGFTEKANVVTANAVTIDWKNSNKQLLTVDANVTITFTAPTNPGSLTLRIVQSGAGHTTTLPTIKWASGNAPTISVGDTDIDVISLYYDGSVYLGNASLDFS